MEILTIGEKIKRARIYKNLTLKELCEKEVSMSKMSCIENNKVQPEDWVLELVSKKLDIDIAYLREGVEEQIIRNIKNIKKSKKDEYYEKNLKYNLDYAEEIQKYELCFEIIHLLYNYYIDMEKLENIELFNFRYYNLYQKASTERNKLMYFMDKARYLSARGESVQAVTYFENLVEDISKRKNKTEEDYQNYIRVCYYCIQCKTDLDRFVEAYNMSIDVMNVFNLVETSQYEAKIYKLASVLSLLLGKHDFDKLKDKVYELYADNEKELSNTIFSYGEILIHKNNIDEGREYIKKSINQYPQNEHKDKSEFMIKCLKLLVEKGFIDEAQEMCDDVVNAAIKLDDIKLIERAYYYKALILEKKEEYISAEMYINLSLDALLKFGNKNQLYKRYMHMGKMYYKMKDTVESIKYFDLALKLERTI